MGYIAAALKKLRKPLIALAIVATVLALATYVTRPREPVYEGEELSEWLLNHGHNEAAVKEAMKATGTNALPVLIKMLEAEDSKLKLWLMRVASKQNLVEWEPTTANRQRFLAMYALSILGKSAYAALPKVKQLFVSGDYTWVVSTSTRECGPTVIIRNCDPDAVGFFINCLTNQNSEVRIVSAFQLGYLGEKAKPAVNQLITALNDKDKAVRSASFIALHRLIDNKSDQFLEVLIPMLDNPDHDFRSGGAIAIGEFGLRAQAVVPKLTQMTQDTNEVVRISASHALKKIVGADFERTTPEVPR